MATANNQYFEKNMVLLEKRHPEVFKIISMAHEFSDRTELVFAKNQKPNLRIKNDENEWVFIHDHDDPGVESEDFLSIVGENSTGVVLMLGMGLGYSVLELLKKRKKIQFMIIFELNIEFFIQALKNIDLTELFMDKRVMICIGEPVELSSFMAPANKALMLENVHTLHLRSCFKLNPIYDKLSSLVFDYINAFNMEGATKSLHGRTFFENRLKHLTSIHHDQKLEDLTGRFKGIPALIIAAGPSLDKNIDQISKAIGKAVIIAVDTALPNLLNHGISPNFITSIDYNELTYEKISGSASNPAVQQINLICTSWVANTVTKQFPANNIFWAFNNNPLENWINMSLGGRMAIGGAGTVAHLNFISANIMGCDPIIFVGQDLAFSNRQSHSSNVFLSNDESTKKMLDSEKDIIWVKGIVEPEVPTNRQMYGYKRVFEKMIKESVRDIINATEGGLLIEGAKNMSLVQAIDSYCKTDIKFDIDYEQGQSSPLQQMQITIKQIKKLEKIIQKADKLAYSIKQILGEQKKGSRKPNSFISLPINLQKKISDLDICHKIIDENKLWPLFDEMTMDGLRQNEREKIEIEKLEGVPDKYFDWLSKSVDRIDKVNKIRIHNLGKFNKDLNELISFYKKEETQLGKIKKNQTNLVNILELARLYYNSGEYVLLEKMLNRYASGIESSAKIHYYFGVIALSRGDFVNAEKRFQSAMKQDESFRADIDSKRYEIADNYWRLANLKTTSVDFGNTIIELLLLKGLKYGSDHKAIKSQFRKLAEDDLEKLKMKSDSTKILLKKWINYIDNGAEVIDCLGKDVVMNFYLSYGKLLVDEKSYQDALHHYHKAYSIFPGSPDIDIALADIYFAVEDFDSGLQYLKSAVSLDKQYAVYWYNMGKNLESQDDFNGAILAYEQYFIAKPEEISVLREIGGCHTKLGNLEAAREAFEQLRRLELKR